MESPVFFETWKHLPRALLYPLTFEATLFIVLGSALLWFFSTSLFGLPIVIFTAIGLAQFLLVNLRHAALGGEDPPKITINSFTQLGSTPLKLLLAITAWSSVTLELANGFPLLATFLALTGFLFLPAFTVLLALEDSLQYALHPLRLGRFVLRGGFLYLLFAAALGFLLQQVRIEFDAARLIFGMPPADILFRLMIGMYLATAASFALGRIAHIAHDFRPPEGHTVSHPETTDRDSPEQVAESLERLLKTQDHETILQAWSAHEDRHCDFQLALLEALRVQRAWPLVPWQAQRCITLLLKNRRGMDALKTALHTLTTHATFATANTEEWLALCRVADECHRLDWLELLAAKARERFPDHAALPDIALLHARHAALKTHDLKKARAILDTCHVPENHPMKDELEKFRKALELQED